MRSWIGLVALTTATLTAFGAAEAGSHGPPPAEVRAAGSCSVPDYPGSGYFTSLTVKRVGCATGRRLSLAYYRCRTKDGPAGKCKRERVMRYRCHEVRVSIETELDGRVTCKRGRKRVVHTYQQDL
jgi:hypothetical protein